MKKYFVLALALVVFAVAPVMADAKVSGEYRYGGLWETGEEEYAGKTTRMRVAVDAAIDDYSSFATRLSSKTLNEGVEAAKFDYYYLSTDWGKFFGTTDMGFGISTTVGKNDAFETEDVVGFTIYDFGGEGIAIEGTEAIKFDFNFWGMVKPYFSKSLGLLMHLPEHRLLMKGNTSLAQLLISHLLQLLFTTARLALTRWQEGFSESMHRDQWKLQTVLTSQ